MRRPVPRGPRDSAREEAARYAAHLHLEGTEQLHQILGRRVALDVGVGREDDLASPIRSNSREQGRDLEVVRADSLDRRERAVQHVVDAPIPTRALEGQDIERLLHDADQGMVALLISADAAGIVGRDVEAR